MADSTNSVSSRKRGSRLGDDIDRSAYTAGQSLTTALNDPREDSRGAWGYWGFRQVDTSWQDPPTPLDPSRYPNITRQHLASYLKVVSGRYENFLRDREGLTEGLQHQLLLEGLGGAYGRAGGRMLRRRYVCGVRSG